MGDEIAYRDNYKMYSIKIDKTAQTANIMLCLDIINHVVSNIPHAR